jgi:hypothetical protein
MLLRFTARAWGTFDCCGATGTSWASHGRSVRGLATVDAMANDAVAVFWR